MYLSYKIIKYFKDEFRKMADQKRNSTDATVYRFGSAVLNELISKRIEKKFRILQERINNEINNSNDLNENEVYNYLLELSQEISEKRNQIRNIDQIEILEYLKLIEDQLAKITGELHQITRSTDPLLKKIESLDYYELLSLTDSATQEEISLRYRQLMNLLHPDRYELIGGFYYKFASFTSKQINAAYNTLRDDQSRENYNKILRQRRA